MSEPAWRREEGGSLLLLLHVQPGAKQTAIVGMHGDGAAARLRIRLAAPPVEGRANTELVRFLAATFGVPLRAVTLVAGASSRKKSVRIVAPALRPDRTWAAVPEAHQTARVRDPAARR